MSKGSTSRRTNVDDLNDEIVVYSIDFALPRRALPVIAANEAETEAKPDKSTVSRCGHGWRAGETWFHPHLLGWKRNSVYDGGWFEWSQDPIASQIEYGESEELTA